MPSSTPTQVIIGGFGPIIERTPTPFPFLARRNNNADTNADTDRDPAARTRAEAHREILCGAIRALCRCEPSRPIDVRALLFPTGSADPVPANSSTVGETIPEEQTLLLAAPTPTNAQTIPEEQTPLLAAPTPTNAQTIPEEQTPLLAAPTPTNAQTIPEEQTPLLAAPTPTNAQTIPEEQAPLLASPTPTNAQTIPEEQTPRLAAPTPTNAQNQLPPVIPAALPPAQFNTGMLPTGRNFPALDRLAREHTALLLDNSCHMGEIWPEMGICIARTTKVLVDRRERSQLSPEDYPYTMDGSVAGIRSSKNEICPTISLQFMDSAVKVRDISYPDTVLKAFESVAPRSNRAPLGEHLFNIVADMFPYPPPNKMPVSARLSLNIIVLTAGYITDDPLKSIDGFRSAMEALDIKDEQVTITLYQVGRNDLAATLLNSYDQVYNSWGSESGRNMVYTEFCEEDHQNISVRSVFRAVAKGMRRRGFI